MVAEHLPYILASEKIDLAVANAENAAGGFGVTPQIAEDLLALGLDVLTSGNHIWDKREIYEYLGKQPRLLRPANYPEELPGRGVAIVKARNGADAAVINVQGRTYMPATECPFRKMDRLLAAIDPAITVRVVDFHAELTSEKMAMGWHLDGKVSLVVGTHTHIPTADTRILPRGTAYQTDVGMTGPYDSVIGVDKDVVLRKFLTSLPVRMEASRKGAELHAVVAQIREDTGQAVQFKRLTIKQT